MLSDRQLAQEVENSPRMLETVPCYRGQKQVEMRDFDVEIELFRVDDYTLYGLVYHYMLGSRSNFPW